MKKIGIFGIGALLVLSVACNKDKALEPSTNYTNTEQKPPKTDVANGGLSTAPNDNLDDNGDAARKKPLTPRTYNEYPFPPNYLPKREVVKGVRNDDVNPYNGTQKQPIKGVRNDGINPYTGTQKEIKPSGTRNDEINNNTSDL